MYRTQSAIRRAAHASFFFTPPPHPPHPLFSFQRCLALPAVLGCGSALLPYSVKYRRCDSPAAACCSLQPQRSVPAVNRAVNPLKMRRCQQATHTRLMTFVGRDFPPHLHTVRSDHPAQDVVGVIGRHFGCTFCREALVRPPQRCRRDEWMNEGALIGSTSADLYDTFFFFQRSRR